MRAHVFEGRAFFVERADDVKNSGVVNADVSKKRLCVFEGVEGRRPANHQLSTESIKGLNEIHEHHNDTPTLTPKQIIGSSSCLAG